MSRLILIFILFSGLSRTNRVFASGKTQSLQWDAAGRLVGLIQRDTPATGFNWTAVYDALGRRLRTASVPVVNGYTNTAGTLTLDSHNDRSHKIQKPAVRQLATDSGFRFKQRWFGAKCIARDTAILATQRPWSI